MARGCANGVPWAGRRASHFAVLRRRYNSLRPETGQRAIRTQIARRLGLQIGAFAMTTQLADHELVLARRMTRLGTETAFEVLSKAKALERQGKSIVHLEIGEPDFDTPKHIVEAAVDALREGWTHYGPSAGLPELREAIAEYVSRTRGVSVQPRRGRRGAGRQAHHVLRACSRSSTKATRSSTPTPAFPSTNR